MALKSPDEYKESLKELDLEVYLFGEKLEENIHDHPVISPSVEAIAKTYDLACDPEYREIMVAKSHLTGEDVNRFTHIHQSVQDLVLKSKMTRLLGRETGTCFQRCVGMDALNALSIVTHNVDEDRGTDYNERFKEYLKYVQGNDLVCDGAMTDTKGDRSRRPADQEDPDQYLHVVEGKDDGIVVKGAKAHQTGAVNSHEIIVMPTRRMKENERSYAVSFAIPSDKEGLKYIYGRHPSDLRKAEDLEMDTGNTKFSGQESLVIFDDVFVPRERIFLFGEHEFAADLVEKFSSYHRQSYACKAGVGDVLIGAASKVAEYNGVRDATHVREKLTEMNHLNETLFSCSLASAYEGVETDSGTFFVDVLKSNVCKLNVTRFPYRLSRLVTDIAGGLVATLPSEKDYRNPEVRDYIEKYLSGKEGEKTEDRMRILRLIENLTMGTGAASYLCESVHGAGSPMAQKMTIAALEDMSEKESSAERIAGIAQEGHSESESGRDDSSD